MRTLTVAAAVLGTTLVALEQSARAPQPEYALAPPPAASAPTDAAALRPAPDVPPDVLTEVVQRTCVVCHNDQALTGNIINVFAHSDFGRAFKAFHRDFLGAVNKKTTVIVLGDARNNYNLPHDWVLKDIQERAKQVIWLNPENRMTWGFGDSEMDRYAPYCTLVQECRNLKQLYDVIDRLVAV